MVATDANLVAATRPAMSDHRRPRRSGRPKARQPFSGAPWVNVDNFTYRPVSLGNATSRQADLDTPQEHLSASLSAVSSIGAPWRHGACRPAATEPLSR